MTTRAKLILGIGLVVIAAAIACLLGDFSSMNVGGTLAPMEVRP